MKEEKKEDSHGSISEAQQSMQSAKPQTHADAIGAARKEAHWKNKNYGKYKHIMGKGDGKRMTILMTEREKEQGLKTLAIAID